MAGDSLLLPLFPLNIVLLPGMLLPLHIFEDRYRLMIGECLERQGEFGIVYRETDRMRDVGCAAAIKQVLRRYADGRLDILASGRGVFRIAELDDKKPYLQGRVEWIEPGDEAAGADLVPHASALLIELSTIVGRPADMVAIARMDTSELAYRLAAEDGFALEERQDILEAASPRQRLEKAIAGFEPILARVRRAAEVRKLIGGNGHFKGRPER
jgi:ATP-dependent Lon protease